MPPYGQPQFGGAPGGAPGGEMAGLESFMPYLMQARMASSMLPGDVTPTSILGLAGKFQEQAQAGGLSSTQAQAMQKVGTAEQLISILSKRFMETSPSQFGPMARLGGGLKRFGAKIGVSPAAIKSYEDFSKGTIGPIVRSLGEVGALSEGDVQRALNLVPNLSDTPEEANRKMSDLMQVLQISKQNIIGLGSGAGMAQQPMFGGTGGQGMPGSTMGFGTY